MTLDPHFQALFDEQARTPPATPPLTQLPPDLVRAGYRAQRTSQNLRTSPAGVEARDLSVGGAAGPIPARLYTPADAATPSGLVVYFHGGGDMTAPFGGYKMSGNGREWGDYGFHEYLETKAVLGYSPKQAAD